MKWIILLIAIGICVATATAMWFVPLVPVEGFAGNRATYQRNFSLNEINDEFLQKHVPAVFIDNKQLALRVGIICLIGVGLSSMCIWKMKTPKDGKKD